MGRPVYINRFASDGHCGMMVFGLASDAYDLEEILKDLINIYCRGSLGLWFLYQSFRIGFEVIGFLDARLSVD